jgi:L-ascorbate metabolism protein UlaG (beta-lactamase superfamily)
MDPYKTDSHLTYPVVRESADIVTISHEHFDHNFTSYVTGNPAIVKDSGCINIKGVEIRGIRAWHDSSKGKERGEIIIYCINIDGIRVCHLGDLGHILADKQIDDVGMVDVLLIPIGGIFTIGIEEASEVCNAIKPKVVIPMHYKTDRCGFVQWGVNDFVKDKKNVRKLETSEIDLRKDNLPVTTEVLVLRYAL